ncbi:hypothetical protein GUJ93_ZPchr0003g18589 [Zizania palustris]|uniref:Uncharacterized protein n=1 Tax=Zizania palustris TaxID=103762 RepID=A0A8J5SGN3_ZIZPA|nr:hypothetical protein GUJ93_ZPchr0003g18589 [Zizania palustris]
MRYMIVAFREGKSSPCKTGAFLEAGTSVVHLAVAVDPLDRDGVEVTPPPAAVAAPSKRPCSLRRDGRFKGDGTKNLEGWGLAMEEPRGRESTTMPPPPSLPPEEEPEGREGRPPWCGDAAEAHSRHSESLRRQEEAEILTVARGREAPGCSACNKPIPRSRPGGNIVVGSSFGSGVD